MPRRDIKTYMIVKTNKGEVRVDKNGTQTPIPDEKKDKSPGKKS